MNSAFLRAPLSLSPHFSFSKTATCHSQNHSHSLRHSRTFTSQSCHHHHQHTMSTSTLTSPSLNSRSALKEFALAATAVLFTSVPSFCNAATEASLRHDVETAVHSASPSSLSDYSQTRRRPRPRPRPTPRPRPRPRSQSYLQTNKQIMTTRLNSQALLISPQSTTTHEPNITMNTSDKSGSISSDVLLTSSTISSKPMESSSYLFESTLPSSLSSKPFFPPSLSFPSLSSFFSSSSSSVPPSEPKVHALPRPNLSAAAEAELFTRMGVAILSGAIIGVERRAASASAGIRTLTLVSLGSAIFSLTALHGLGGDPARMGAAISTGIGFLGSGAINGQISGSRRQLVTAASIWVAAALGVAAAAGLFTLAITGAFVTIWIMRWRLVLSLILISLKPFQPFISTLSKLQQKQQQQQSLRNESEQGGGGGGGERQQQGNLER